MFRLCLPTLLTSFSDTIHDNVTVVATNTENAAQELTQASEYQRKAGRRAACLMLVIVIVICVVLIAVRIAVLALMFPW